MSHKQQIEAIKIISKSLITKNKLRIMEVGSYNVNGEIRSTFEYEKYFGIDLSPGPNVDIVGSGHEIDLIKENINLCISSECFEHNPYWKETLLNMAKHLKQGGFIVITAAINGRLEHGTVRTDPKHSPGSNSIGWNYYKNIQIEEINDYIKTLPGYCKSYIYNQKITFDLYAVIVINNQIDYKINTLELDHLKKLNKLDYSIKGIAYQLWILPMRIVSIFFNEEKYLSIGVIYERYTKRIILNVIAKLKK